MTAAGVALLEPEELNLGLDALDESHGGRLWVCVCGNEGDDAPRGIAVGGVWS